MTPLRFGAFAAALTAACVMTNTVTAAAPAPPAPSAGPWDVPSLQSADVAITWAPEGVGPRGLYYVGEPYRGQPTRVFAYVAFPANAGSGERFPGMVLVHGGGSGTAFPEWATQWAERGYVAISMDLAGRGPDRQRLPDGGPDDSGKEKFDAIRDDPKDVWSYHAVANVLRAVTALSRMPQVDPERIGMMGVSWGGYVTCIAASIDPRIRVAVPVYGCGFLNVSSEWTGVFELMGEVHTQRWISHFDPAIYLSQAKAPMLFITGTGDTSYPLDSHRASSRLPEGPVTLSVRPDMKHGHSPAWEVIENGIFVDAVLKPGPESPPLAHLKDMQRVADRVTARFESARPIVKAELLYTTDTSAWPNRTWQISPMQLDEGECSGTLPTSAPLAYFVNLTDDRGAVVSSAYELVAGAAP